MKIMNKGKTGWKILVVLCVFAGAAFAYFHWSGEDAVGAREEMLSRLPGDPTAVIFVDAAQLRTSPFLEQLFSWAPQVAPDADYTQFVQATGFHYEKDLERAAIAVMRQGNNAVTYVAIADGKFDRKKIEAYAASSGRKETVSGRAIFALNVGGRGKTSFFTFLRDDRIAWTDDPSYAAILLQRTAAISPEEWREHFRRLAGTPLFVVLRQDSGSPSPLAEQAPGGFQSPQLAALLGQLQWISIAGKPDGNLLRVVVDGESLSEQTIKQLNDFLKGVVVLAQMGLSEAKTRKQLDPQLREGYLELLQSADIEKMDRGSSKSVRVVFEVTPKLLEAARGAGARPGTGKEAGKQGLGEKVR
jgi:hypothetical protein